MGFLFLLSNTPRGLTLHFTVETLSQILTHFKELELKIKKLFSNRRHHQNMKD